MNILKSYSDKLVELNLFKNNNAQLFQDFENLQDELSKLEVELKTEAKEKGDLENDIVRVLVSERYKKFYNIDKFLDSADKSEVQNLEKAKGIKREIDKKIFDECYSQGLITVMTKQASFSEEFIGKMITIKSKLK